MDERDIEFEVVDLAKGTTVRSPLAPESDAPDTPRHRHIPSHRLIASIALAVLAVVLVATLVPQLRQAGQNGSDHPPLPALDEVYFQNGVPWGSLRIDGTISADMYLVRPDWSMSIGTGHHTLVYKAAPFPPLTCHFSVPASPADDCFIRSTGQGQPEHLVISLGLSPNHLPPGQLDALSAAVSSALANDVWSTRVASGERYIAPDGRIAVADAPLIARMTYTLNTPQDSAKVSPGVACPDFCASGAPPVLPGGRYAWMLRAPISVSWQYATSDGTVVAGSAPAALAPAPAFATIGVGVWYDGTWHAISPTRTVDFSPPENATCAVAQTELSAMRLLPQAGYTLGTSSEPNPADGCLISVTGTYVTNGQAAAIHALYLYRFGVALAANDGAHAVAPFLPVVSGQTETDLVRQLASQLGPQG